MYNSGASLDADDAVTPKRHLMLILLMLMTPVLMVKVMLLALLVHPSSARAIL